MPYDPTIALKVAQPQFDVGTAVQNALAFRNAQQAGQLNQLKLQQEQQSMQEAAGLQNYLAQNPDLSSEEAQNRLVSQYGQKGLEILNTRQELANRRQQEQTYKQEYDENRHKEVNRAISDISKYANKDDAIAGIERNFEEGKLDQNAYDAVMGMVRAEPVWARSQSKILQSLLSEKEQLEVSKPTTEERTDGQSKWQIYSNPNLPNYGQEVPKSRITLQLTPAQKEDQRQFNVTEKRLSEAEKRLSEAAKAKTEAPASTTRESALAFLKEAGYKAGKDATTDTDDVSSMLPESTSGWVQRKGSEIYGGVTGKSTEGQKVLGKLESRASKLVTNMLGGKLGAGISNPDREFMVKAVGDIGNADVPFDKRLSAWKDLMLRMKAAAGVVPANIALPVPGGAGAGAGLQPAAKTVVRKGTANGKRVVQYSDGSVEYAP